MESRVASDSPRAALKRVGPPAVSVEAQRLEGDRLQITFTYYAHGTGKLEQVKCSGSLSQIEGEVQKLLHLEEELHRRVVGQDEAVTAVAEAVV